MYHISKDKRAITSAKRIGEGVLKCLRNKSFTEITVTDVQKISSVGRSTFYRLFDNTSDVLSYLCDDVFEQARREYATMSSLSLNETTMIFIKKWMDNKLLLKAITASNRLDCLYSAHTKYLGKEKDKFFPNVDLSGPQTEYLMMTMTACVSACLTAWLKTGAKENAEQLHERLKSCFNTFCGIFDR